MAEDRVPGEIRSVLVLDAFRQELDERIQKKTNVGDVVEWDVGLVLNDREKWNERPEFHIYIELHRPYWDDLMTDGFRHPDIDPQPDTGTTSWFADVIPYHSAFDEVWITAWLADAWNLLESGAIAAFNDLLTDDDEEEEGGHHEEEYQ